MMERKNSAAVTKCKTSAEIPMTCNGQVTTGTLCLYPENKVDLV
ncbi:MAG: hypothetical protein ACXWC7_16795 [Chitinophagaceae bacterium]